MKAVTKKVKTKTPRTVFQGIQKALNDSFPERQEVIHGILCALLSQEHVLLLGPPGTAKSALARVVSQIFGVQYFERLLTKFSTPEELFGPISLKALEQDSYKRIVTGRLPEAEIAFIDEIFKSNSAVLNSLLSLINERIFHNDTDVLQCPLQSMIGASNELPEGSELEALFDRFILRYDIKYIVNPASFEQVLTAPNPEVTIKSNASRLAEAQEEVEQVTITDPTVEALIELRSACQSEGLIVSDRRWKKSLQMSRAVAWLIGEDETSSEDLSILAHSLWRDPKDKAKVRNLVGRICDPVGSQAMEVLDAAREKADQISKMRFTNKREFHMQGADALQVFLSQMSEIEKLRAKAGKRAAVACDNAYKSLQAMHDTIARTISAGLGLSRIGHSELEA